MTHQNTSRAYHRARRAAAKAAGVCMVCQKAPAVSGLTSCQACRERVNATQRKRQRRLRAIHKRLGVCVTCNTRQAMSGCSICGYCSEQREAIREAHLAAGLCCDCSRPAVVGITRCEIHRGRRRAA